MRIRSIFCAAAALSVGALTSRATFTWWTGATDQLWSDNTNWTNNAPTLLFTAEFNTPSTSVVDMSFTIHVVDINAGTPGLVTINSSGGSTITLVGGGAGVQDNSSNAVALNVGILGTGDMDLNSGGLLTITGTNLSSYTGHTHVTSGTFADGAAYSFSPNSIIQVGPAGAVNVNFDETVAGLDDLGGGNGSVVIAGGNLLFDVGVTTTNFSGVISGGGGLEKDGASTLVLLNSNTYTGQTIIGAGSAIWLGNGGVTGSILSNGVSGGGALAFNRSDAKIFSSTLSGALSVVQLGSGSTSLSGTNTYTGGTTVFSGEIYLPSSTIGAPGSIVSGPVGTGTITMDPGTTISPIGASQTLANAINIVGGAQDDLVDDFSPLSLVASGNITGAGGIEWCGNGTLTLTGTNNFTGGVDMRIGTVLVGNNSALGTGTLTLETATLADFGVGASVALSNAINLTGASQIGQNDNNSLTLTGPMTGSGSIAYQGGPSGTLTLDADNSGANVTFVIQSGTAIAGNNNALGPSTNAVTLAGGVTLNVMNGVTVNNAILTAGSANVLAGNGSIGIPVTVDNTLVLSPSASPGGGPGNLTFTSPLTFASGGTINFHLFDANGAPGVGYSTISANGGLGFTAAPNTLTFNVITIDGFGNLAAAVNFNPANSYSWLFASSPSVPSGFTGNQFNIGTSLFANATGGGTFNVSEVGNNLFLNFTPVPEPSTWALIAAGVFALVPVALLRRHLKKI